MSLYTFAAASLTTEDDHKRRPAIDRGQLIRTLTLAGLFIVALTFMAHQSDAADEGFQSAGISSSGALGAALLPRHSVGAPRDASILASR